MHAFVLLTELFPLETVPIPDVMLYSEKDILKGYGAVIHNSSVSVEVCATSRYIVGGNRPEIEEVQFKICINKNSVGKRPMKGG